MPTLQRQVNSDSPGSPTDGQPTAVSTTMAASSQSGLALNTPSPQAVLQDLIGATAHEIISVEPDNHQSSSSIYAAHAERLGYYMNQYTDLAKDSDEDHNDLFDDDDDDDAKPLIDDMNVRCRLLMARLVLDVMLRKSDVDEATPTRSYVSHVNDLDAEGWNNIRDDLSKLVQWLAETKKVDADAGEIIQAHLKAFQSVALLRSQLKSTVGKIARRRKQKISQYKNTTDFIVSYRDARDEISGSVDDLLLLPDEVISFDLPKSVKTLKESLERIISAIDDFVEGEALPLKALQSNLSTTLKSWERRLDRPALYECGYFESPLSSETKPASSEKANRNTHRHKDDSSEDSDDSEDDQILMKLKKAKSNKAKSKTVYRSDSDDDTLTEHPPQKKKRRKRIPYSEEEKTAVLDGVEKFGKGKWAEILEDNSDLFAVNKRTNINLKDLYRNLTK